MRTRRLATWAAVFALGSAACSQNDATPTDQPSPVVPRDGGGSEASPTGDDASPPADSGQNEAAADGSLEDATDGAAGDSADSTSADAPDSLADALDSAPTSGDAPEEPSQIGDGGIQCSLQCVHGACLASGGCACDPGWTGTLCDTTSTALSSGMPVAGSVTRGNWTYYSYYGPATGLNVSLTEDTTTGLVWAYLGAGMAPDQSNHLAANEDTQSASHPVTYSFASSGMQTWYVGAYGQPAIATGQVVTFHLLMNVIP